MANDRYRTLVYFICIYSFCNTSRHVFRLKTNSRFVYSVCFSPQPYTTHIYIYIFIRTVVSDIDELTSFAQRTRVMCLRVTLLINDDVLLLSSCVVAVPPTCDRVSRLPAVVPRTTNRSVVWIGEPRPEQYGQAATSPLFTKINTITSSETFDIIHHNLIGQWQKYWLNLPLPNKLRNVKLYIKKIEIPSWQ